MSETPDQPTASDRPEPTRTDDAAEHEPLDVAEWVSELRRLYVEPTTNAEQHRESGMAPLRRMLHLRGSRHVEPSVESHPAPELSPLKPSPTSLRGLAQRPDPVSDPAEEHPESAPGDDSGGAGAEPILGSPQVDEESGETEGPSSAAWLLSYLEARGLRPGAPVTVLARSESLDSLTLEGPLGRATLGLRPAALVRVLTGAADPTLFHRVPRPAD